MPNGETCARPYTRLWDGEIALNPTRSTIRRGMMIVLFLPRSDERKKERRKGPSRNQMPSKESELNTREGKGRREERKEEVWGRMHPADILFSHVVRGKKSQASALRMRVRWSTTWFGFDFPIGNQY